MTLGRERNARPRNENRGRLSRTIDTRSAASPGRVRFAVALLLLATPCCTGAERGSPTEASRPSAGSGTAEQQVFYTDMVEAYAAGRIDEGRALAHAHLDRLEARLAGPLPGLERQSIAQDALGLLRSLLHAERTSASALPADLDGRCRDMLRAARRLAEDASAGDPRLGSYLEAETGRAAAEWIRARQPSVGREEIERAFDELRPALDSGGFDSLEAVLAARDAGMELALEAQQKSYRLGEPVTFLLTAENRGREPVTTSVVLAPSAGFVQFFVSGDGEEFRQYVGPGWGTRDVFLEPRPVAPGERFEMTYALLWHHGIPGEEGLLQQALPFRREGCYRVKASSLLHGFDRESNTVEVCLTAPEREDLAVWEAMLETPELARFIQHPLGEPNPEIPQRAAALLAEHPTSSYAPYLREAVRIRREVEPGTVEDARDP